MFEIGYFFLHNIVYHNWIISESLFILPLHITDPFELQNRLDTLKPEERSYLHDLLARLVACKGKSCTIGQHSAQNIRPRAKTNVLSLHSMNQQQYKKRRFPETGEYLIKKVTLYKPEQYFCIS